MWKGNIRSKGKGMKRIMNVPMPGMRMLKTALAVFLCFVIVALMGEQYSGYSAVVAIVCMQKDWGDSKRIAINRSIGTICGAGFGILTHKLLEWLNWYERLVLPYLIVCLMMLLLMMVIVSINKKDVTAVSCIIFLSVSILHDPKIDVWFFAIRRMVDTFVGIVVSLIINICLTEEFFSKFKRARNDESNSF